MIFSKNPLLHVAENVVVKGKLKKIALNIIKSRNRRNIRHAT